jgi:ADP-ribosylglycohydrolase
MINKNFLSLVLLLAMEASAQVKKQSPFTDRQTITLPVSVLQDKIRGGWAGQTIGVSYGGPFEFKFLGTMINDYQTLPWPDGYIRRCFDKEPGLYDDIYMDLSFVNVINKYGVDAPVDSFANAFANAPYPLWHANQAGRYNLLNGIRPPQSGYWLNNPHADDIDFQIEADFAGLMFPGMSNSAATLCDKVGHIMNYGDGYYGGVYVASMYCHAFVSSDINFIVTEALKSIPVKSRYHECINDVINWHKKYPRDWKATWFEVQRKWTEDIACTDGVFVPFDISSKVNSAYVVMGLLYGGGDFAKTMDIAIRCGQDADCNPSSAAGILGTVLGYDKIPDFWKRNLKEVEDRDFVYTGISLNKMYALGYKHALEMIRKNGGVVKDNAVSLIYQKPMAVKFEESFPGLIPVQRISLGGEGIILKDTFSFPFEGNGITLSSGMSDEWNAKSDYVFKVEADIDGVKETIRLPYNFRVRKNELLAKYNLAMGKHILKLTLLNPDKMGDILLKDIIIYSDKPLKNEFK